MVRPIRQSPLNIVRDKQGRQAHHKIATGVARSSLKAPARQVHSVPADLRKALIQAPAARAVWEDITPLARNEWICWVVSGKKNRDKGYPYQESSFKA